MLHWTSRFTALAALLVSSISWAAPPAFRIVSDIDDTAKIINVAKGWDAFRNALFSRKTFTGMSELYQGLAESAGSEAPVLHWISGSPSFLGARIKKVLEKYNHFPKAEYYLRGILKDRDLVAFKGQRLLRLSLMNDEPFVLLGDDTQKDPEIYASFVGVVGESRVLARYIHVIRNREIAAGSKPFYTAFDVSLEEWEAGRLTEAQALAIGERITASLPEHAELAFPKFAYCPTEEILPEPGPKQLASVQALALRDAYVAEVATLCEQRRAELPESERLELLEQAQQIANET